ncbi:MAG: multiheme c-type cytochrome [Gammaproteobacteria bacterium]
MMTRTFKRLAVIAATVAATSITITAHAEPFNVGYKKCNKCHEAEVDVWKETAHFKSYKAVHKKDEAKKILKAVGGAKSMKKSEVCASCHYTAIQKKAGAKAKIKAGPSCESCHGTSSEWIDIHNDYGDAEEAKDETPAHKTQRIADASAAGMIWPSEKYDVASNCMSCHGLAHPDIDGDTLSTMLDAGHPIEPGFELVAYSQGSVRHRFYPPDVNTNAEMNAAELSNLFAVGQIARLVSASSAADKSQHADYKAAQEERAKAARAALEPLASIAEVKAFLGAPSDDNARTAVKALEGQDLSAQLGGMLPAKSDYK